MDYLLNPKKTEAQKKIYIEKYIGETDFIFEAERPLNIITNLNSLNQIVININYCDLKIEFIVSSFNKENLKVTSFNKDKFEMNINITENHFSRKYYNNLKLTDIESKICKTIDEYLNEIECVKERVLEYLHLALKRITKKNKMTKKNTML